MMRSLMKVMRLLVASAVLESMIQVDDYRSCSRLIYFVLWPHSSQRKTIHNVDPSMLEIGLSTITFLFTAKISDGSEMRDQ